MNRLSQTVNVQPRYMTPDDRRMLLQLLAAAEDEYLARFGRYPDDTELRGFLLAEAARSKRRRLG